MYKISQNIANVFLHCVVSCGHLVKPLLITVYTVEMFWVLECCDALYWRRAAVQPVGFFVNFTPWKTREFTLRHQHTF